MSVEQTLEYGELTVEIDNWCGVHIDMPDGVDVVSLSPLMMHDIEQARKDVLDNQHTNNE